MRPRHWLLGVDNQPEDAPRRRAEAYARFFSTPRSLKEAPHLVPERELKTDEIQRFHEIERRLLDLASPGATAAKLAVDAGPVVVICPTLPEDLQGSLADELDPNYTRLRRYSDLDALIELYGHLRAENPTLDVFHRIDTDSRNDDLTSHVVLVGGVGWRGIR